MQYCGDYKIGRKKHSGMCEVDSGNNIYLTIYNNDIQGDKHKIKGQEGEGYIMIYNSRLNKFDVGYQKYFSEYLVVCKTLVICGKTDFSKNIHDFRFTFEPLGEWLGLEPLKIFDENIKIEMPRDIILIDFETLKIKIKFYVEREETSLETRYINMKVVPYIVVESEKRITWKEVKKYVQIITRFFSTLIGFSSNVNKIYFHNYYKNRKVLESCENALIINTDFSNNYDGREEYVGLRTKYNDLKEKISDMFYLWYTKYNDKEYEDIINQFYTPYLRNTIEERFLTFTRIMEKIGACKFENKEKTREFQEILKDFYKIHEEDLKESLRDVNIRSEYIKNIEDIHEEVIEKVIKKYENRQSLSAKIKNLDYSEKLKENFEEKHISNKKGKRQFTVYDYIANTRNYYVHLGKRDNILSNDYIMEYNRLFEQIIVGELLEIIGFTRNETKKIIEEDRYLMAYKDWKVLQEYKNKKKE